ncbi:hypothetical protein BDB01DRAFT_845831 [Pilobolus umbonatus]|nr:hypothetical protein BDB01DRAFT_845831 [Pilobolus umbonatus]
MSIGELLEESNQRSSSDSFNMNTDSLAPLQYDKVATNNKIVYDDHYVDGPLFRATIKQLEGRTGTLKASLKKINKAAATSLETRQQLSKMDNCFIESLRESHCADPLMSHYLNNAWNIIREERAKLDDLMSTQLLEPLRRIYEDDIKNAEIKKRLFEEESKDYYAYLSKYLKANKKRQETEDKQTVRKRRFDLARFDYLSFLMDLHGGKKENDILFYLTRHSMKEFDFYKSIAQKIEHEKTGLNELLFLVNETAREQEATTNERALKRKELQSLCNINILNNSDVSLNDDPIGPITSSEGLDSVIDHTKLQPMNELIMNRISTDRSEPIHKLFMEESAESNKFKGIRDLDHHTTKDSASGRKKEGFLFATSKPSKTTGFDVSSSAVYWHKYWCVLSNGQLHEYSNWKRQLESHIDPINLRFATVREARNSERRFCFEVITPHLRRIYQATSQEECQSWITTIHNSIESLLIGNSSSANLCNMMNSDNPVSASHNNISHNGNNSTPRRHVRSLSGAFKSSLAAVGGASKERTGKRQSNTPAEGAELLVSVNNPPDRFRWSGFPFGNYHSSNNVKQSNTGSNSQHQQNHHQMKPTSIKSHYLFSPFPDSEMNYRLLSLLREDPSNLFCADCGSKDPNWCSLNLGILLCIECSGIHRSLGTHISKIRSLTLDSTSYTLDIIELLRSIGNARSNAIWDHRIYGLNDNSSDAILDPSSDITLGSASGARRPNSTDPRSTKLAYIQDKYVQRKFVKRPSPGTHNETHSPNQILFEAIGNDDIPKALYALALGANVNSPKAEDMNFIGQLINECKQKNPSSVDDSPISPINTNMPFLYMGNSSNRTSRGSDTQSEYYMSKYPLHYALIHGRSVNDESVHNISNISFGSPSEDESLLSATLESHARMDRNVIFPMAEFLFQNGADTGVIDSETGHTLADVLGTCSIVTDEAISYINHKNTARGQSAIIRASMLLPIKPVVCRHSKSMNEVISSSVPLPPLPDKDIGRLVMSKSTSTFTYKTTEPSDHH